VHRVPWPKGSELIEIAGAADEGGVIALDAAALVLGEIRKKKSAEQRPIKTPARVVRVTDAAERAALLEDVRADLTASGPIERLEIGTGDFAVHVELAPAETLSRESSS
jgi:hypothetical protein